MYARSVGTAVLIALAACGDAAAPRQAHAQAPAPATRSAADLSAALQATARSVTPAVVEIFTTTYAPGSGLVPRTADLVRRERGSGSGVIVDPGGFIVTNAHVVRGAQRVRVEIPLPPVGDSILSARSRTVPARVVGLDVETDLAVLQVDETNLSALAFGDSDELEAGQLVLAFGSPLGLDNSVTLGVVSSVARQLEPESPMIYIQTDASINPGSSGGPLVDTQGRLMGINTLIVSETGGNDGLGFAAPSNIVRSVYEQIRSTGYVKRGEIGIRGQTITPVLAAGLGLQRDSGVILADVAPGSPADRAGLRRGDLVLALDGKPMENGRQLHVGLYRRRVGEMVTLRVLRGAETIEVPVLVAERDDALAGLSSSVDPRDGLVSPLGILGVPLNRRIAAMVPVLRVSSGVLVVSTAAGAIDSRDGGLAPGDVVYAVNTRPVAGLDDLRGALAALKPGDPVVLEIERRGELIYLSFTVD